MSAVAALKAARAAGVELALDGDDLVLEAASAPPVAVARSPDLTTHLKNETKEIRQ